MLETQVARQEAKEYKASLNAPDIAKPPFDSAPNSSVYVSPVRNRSQYRRRFADAIELANSGSYFVDRILFARPVAYTTLTRDAQYVERFVDSWPKGRPATASIR